MEAADRTRIIAAYRSTGGRRGEVSEVTAAGPMQVVLRTKYEVRFHDVIFEPTHETRDRVELPSADPWSVQHEASPGPEKCVTRRRLDGASQIIECPPCGKTGDEMCTTCHGNGTVQRAGANGRSRTETCTTCNGSGNIDCLSCHGGRYVRATSQIEIETGTMVRSRVIESEELPVELLIEIGERTDDGKVVYREEGKPLTLQGNSGGYRGQSARVSPAVDHKLEELLEEELFTEPYVVHGHELEVLQVPVYRLDLTGGGTGWVYGEPLRAWGEKGSVWPWLAAGAAALAAAVSAYLALS